jgi:hypothetical protein
MPFLHCIDKFVVGPAADPCRCVGCDVRGEQDAERRFEGAAAGERLAAGRRMAGSAIGGRRHIAAVLDDLERLLVRVLRARRRVGEQQQRASEEHVSHGGAPHACTSGPGFFRYCLWIVSSDQ